MKSGAVVKGRQQQWGQRWGIGGVGFSAGDGSGDVGDAGGGGDGDGGLVGGRCGG